MPFVVVSDDLLAKNGSLHCQNPLEEEIENLAAGEAYLDKHGLIRRVLQISGIDNSMKWAASAALPMTNMKESVRTLAADRRRNDGCTPLQSGHRPGCNSRRRKVSLASR